jgi:hypothetical protein
LRLTWRDAGVEAYAGVKATRVVDDAQAGSGRYRLRVEFGEQQRFDITGPAASNGTARLPSGLSVQASVENFETSPVRADDKALLDLDVAPEDAPRPGEVIIASFGTRPPGAGCRRRDGRACVRLSVRDGPFVCGAGDCGIATARFPTTFPSLSGSRSICGLAKAPHHRAGLGIWGSPKDMHVTSVRCLTIAPSTARLIRWTLLNGVTRSRRGFQSRGQGARRSASRSEWRRCRLTISTPWCRPVRPSSETVWPCLNRRCSSTGALANSLTATLQDDTDFLRFMAREEREPWGIHRALTVDEPSLISVPDAAQPGWEPMTPDYPLAPDPSASLAQDSCPEDDFIECGAVLGKAPVLESKTDAGDAGASLEWTAEPQAERFVLEESTSRDWRGAVVVFEGDAEPDHAPTACSWRLLLPCPRVDAYPTEWSNGVAVRVAPGAGFRVRRASEYRDDVLPRRAPGSASDVRRQA